MDKWNLIKNIEECLSDCKTEENIRFRTQEIIQVIKQVSYIEIEREKAGIR